MVATSGYCMVNVGFLLATLELQWVHRFNVQLHSTCVIENLCD